MTTIVITSQKQFDSVINNGRIELYIKVSLRDFKSDYLPGSELYIDIPRYEGNDAPFECGLKAVILDIIREPNYRVLHVREI